MKRGRTVTGHSEVLSLRPKSSQVAARRLAANLVFCVLLFSIVGAAQIKSAATLEGSDLVTPGDFPEYPSVHGANVHELHFSAVLYEGAESCLLCPGYEARTSVYTGHFNWRGQAENIAGFEGRVVGKKRTSGKEEPRGSSVQRSFRASAFNMASSSSSLSRAWKYWGCSSIDFVMCALASISRS